MSLLQCEKCYGHVYNGRCTFCERLPDAEDSDAYGDDECPPLIDEPSGKFEVSWDCPPPIAKPFAETVSVQITCQVCGIVRVLCECKCRKCGAGLKNSICQECSKPPKSSAPDGHLYCHLCNKISKFKDPSDFCCSKCDPHM